MEYLGKTGLYVKTNEDDVEEEIMVSGDIKFITKYYKGSFDDFSRLTSCHSEILSTNYIQESGEKIPRYIKHGHYVSFYEDGKIHTKGTHSHGLRHGVWITFHPNGNKWYQTVFEHGKVLDQMFIYSTSGEILYYQEYENGEFIRDVLYDTKHYNHIDEFYSLSSLDKITAYELSWI